MNAEAQAMAAEAARMQQEKVKAEMARMKATHDAAAQAAANAGQAERGKPMPVTAEKRVGRNDPCPCGSGKKYKVCHGK